MSSLHESSSVLYPFPIMDDEPSYTMIQCVCGHRGYVATSRWLHRDEIMQRARCKVCRRKTAEALIALPGPRHAKEGEREFAAMLSALPVIEV